jgi:hypothetical protein
MGGRGFMRENGWEGVYEGKGGGGEKRKKETKRGKKRNLRENRWLN